MTTERDREVAAATASWGWVWLDENGEPLADLADAITEHIREAPPGSLAHYLFTSGTEGGAEA